MKKIILGYLGVTKHSKTTTIATLTDIPEKLLNLSIDTELRTKATVEYHIVSYNLNEIFIEKIDVIEQNIIGNGDIEKYNNLIEKDHFILKNTFNLEKVSEKIKLREYVSGKLKLLNDTTISLEKLKELLSTENLDNYIRKITLKVSANNKIKDYLQEKNIDLFIRDTRGLLDFETDERNIKTDTTKSLKDLGLDGLSGLVFFGSEDYPKIVESLYGGIIKSLFNSIPVFIVKSKIKSIFNKFINDDESNYYDKIPNIIDIVQKENPDWEEEYFDGTLQLLESFKVTYLDHNDKYKIRGNLFEDKKIKLMLPYCKQLNKSSDINFILKDKMFKLFKNMATYYCIETIEMINFLEELFRDTVKKGSELLIETSFCRLDELLNDFKKFDNHYNSHKAPKYFKPQFEQLSKNYILEEIDNKNTPILGPYGGITYKTNGKFSYPLTIVMAVTSKKWLDSVISEIELNKEKYTIPNENYKYDTYFKAESIELIKKSLSNSLYKRYTDNEQTIAGHLLIDRKRVKNAIEERRKNITETPSYLDVIIRIVNDFCKSIKEEVETNPYEIINLDNN